MWDLSAGVQGERGEAKHFFLQNRTEAVGNIPRGFRFPLTYWLIHIQLLDMIPSL